MMKIGKKMKNKLENKILLNKIYLSNKFFLFNFFRRMNYILIIFMKIFKIIKFRKYILLKL
jgi:hypothetical protein